MPRYNPREIIQWLRDTYDVRPTLGHGGKHPFLRFDYQGSERRITIANTPSDRRAFNNMLQSVRRELGEPPPPFSRAKRRMEDLMPQPQPFNPPIITVQNKPEPVPAAPEKILGTAARYKGNNMLILSFLEQPPLFDPAVRYGLRLQSDSCWEVIPHAGRSGLRRHGNEWVLAFGRAGGEYFGRTPCECIAVDDHIMISLTEPMRQIKQLASQKRKPEPPAPKPLVPEPPQLVIVTKELMIHALTLIRVVETRSDWRLMWTDGEWRFRVPDVALPKK